MRFVVVMRRHHKIGLVRIQALQRLLERREPEEPVLLLVALEHDLVNRAAVALEDLVFDLEVRTPRAVPALVEPLVCVPVVVHALEHLLDALHVLGVRGADEEIVRRLEPRHQRLEPLGVAIGQLLRLES